MIKDLRNRVLYYQGYGDHTFCAIRLTRLNLRPDARRLSEAKPAGGGIIDVTGDLGR